MENVVSRMGTLDHVAFFVDGAEANQIRQLYRRIGIGLNLRRRACGYEQHVASNSGIKLINCCGFGIASVSEPEPAYLEIGDGCTIFTSSLNQLDKMPCGSSAI